MHREKLASDSVQRSLLLYHWITLTAETHSTALSHRSITHEVCYDKVRTNFYPDHHHRLPLRWTGKALSTNET